MHVMVTLQGMEWQMKERSCRVLLVMRVNWSECWHGHGILPCAELPRARGSLITALQRPRQGRPEAGQARLPGSAGPADEASLLDNLSAQLEGSSGAASSRGLEPPVQRTFREEPVRSACSSDLA